MLPGLRFSRRAGTFVVIYVVIVVQCKIVVVRVVDCGSVDMCNCLRGYVRRSSGMIWTEISPRLGPITSEVLWSEVPL